MVTPVKEDLISWNATFELRGAFGASVRLTNQNSQYDSSLLMTDLLIETSVVATGSPSPDPCFGGLTQWIIGIISSVQDGEEVDHGIIDLKLRSFFSRLNTRPVNTYRYDTTGDGVLA